MSNIKYKVLVLITCFTIGACDDILETIPTDRISTEIFWKTDQDALLAANAVYTFLVENASHYVSWDGMSDIGYTHQPQSAESFILQGQFDALNSRVKDDWAKMYAGIRAANSFLTHVEKLEPTNANLINRLKGEVKTLRAYFYIRLAALYGDVPLHTTEVSLEESKTVSRAPVSQVWDFISAELTEAAGMLPNTQTEKGRITKGAALGILSRAMLYAGRYQEAA
ncbi:MAG: RagB/SusD family nutrient uptake outer membrane protein, partial [Bacteroidota bacterium]|nr:RagB/SusD family nutrient uptake outer membrane protein [Bacteroidota bacterium]